MKQSMNLNVLASFILLLGSAAAQSATYSYAYTYNQTINPKNNCTERLKIGIHGSNFALDVQSTMAMAHYLNKRSDILPNTSIDLYWTVAPSNAPSNDLLGALFQINNLNVLGLISGQATSESETVQLAAKIWNIPQISSVSLSQELDDKITYPYFMRTIPDEGLMIDGIVALFVRFGWKKGVIVYSGDDFGSGYARLEAAAVLSNITFASVVIPSASSQPSDVASAMNVVESLLTHQEYRIFVMYTASITAEKTFRTAMNQSGYVNPEFVYILATSSMATYYNTPWILNDGAIGLYIQAPYGDVYTEWLDDWMNGNDSTYDPWTYRQHPTYSSTYMVDALLAFVHAADNLLNSGVSFSSIKNSVYLHALLNTSFMGTTGPVSFTSIGDRIGNLQFYTLTPTSATVVGTIYASNGSYVQTGQYIFANGTTEIPLDSPYCFNLQCNFGTCEPNVGCICDAGYTGVNCIEPITTSSSVAWIAAPIGVMVVALIGGYYFYRRKKILLVKGIAEKQRSNINPSDLTITKPIGRGASGEVFKATFRGTEVAVKKINATRTDKDTVNEFEMEVAIMCGLRHPNIILFMGSCFDQVESDMMIVMEFMARGSLHDVLHNPQIELPYDLKLHLACQAAQGMNFLHQSTPPIVHQDLKSHNILLDEKWNARISDFGLTRFKTATSDYNNKGSGIGTIYWSAPECLDGAPSTEKSDVYSFGIVLWEIFHRQDPYCGRDPVAVAIEIIRNQLRPAINSSVPQEIQSLIKSIWAQDPVLRPSFQEIMLTLRDLSQQNSMLGTGVSAHTGLVYIVKTSIIGALTIMENCPRDMCLALEIHNNVMRSILAEHHGYEASLDLFDFTFSFATCEDAINFCAAVQFALLQQSWPSDVLKSALGAPTSSPSGTLLWRGLPVQMAVVAGVPNCEIDSSTGRMIYFGHVVDQAERMIKTKHKGMVLISESIITEVQKAKITGISIQTGTSTKEDGTKVPVHWLMIQGLEEREGTATTAYTGAVPPHVVLNVEELDSLTATRTASFYATAQASTCSWVTRHEEIVAVRKLARGPIGDFSLCQWRSNKEAVVKTLISQRLRESDMMRFVADAAVMSKLTHPNLVSFYAICIDHEHLSIITEYVPKGDLRTILSNKETQLPLQTRVRMALDIANGMQYLTSQEDVSLRKHDNLKSTNILVCRDYTAKIADYGQGHIKDVARTMTSVGSVAWTAPEILSGEDAGPQIALYSFGIIMWELYTLQFPYAGEHPIRVVTKILDGYRPALPADCNAEYKRLVEQCLRSNPNDRPSWNTIVTTLTGVIQWLK